MAIEYLETREVAVGQLSRFPGNARRGNVPKIRESIRRNGQYRSLVVRVLGDQDGQLELVILAGNHTYDAICAEGHKTARCELIRCDDHTARRINLADNRLSDIAVDDNDALVELLSYLDGDYEGTGWVEEDVERLLEPGVEEGDAGQDDLPRAWGVIVECDDEGTQAALLAELDGRGLKVKALMN